MEQLDFNLSREERASKIAADVRSRLDAGNKTTGAPNTGGDLFDAVLDTVNPLQHIPVVSNVYRAATGDGTSPLASMAGGFLFGGPLGLAVGAASSFIEIVTGKSPAAHAMALLDTLGDDKKQNDAQTVAVADAHDGLLGGGPLVGKTEHMAGAAANIFNEADNNFRPGFGAAKSTVEYSSNIWTQAAIADVTSKYDSALSNNKYARSPADRTAGQTQRNV